MIVAFIYYPRSPEENDRLKASDENYQNCLDRYSQIYNNMRNDTINTTKINETTVICDIIHDYPRDNGFTILMLYGGRVLLIGGILQTESDTIWFLLSKFR